MPREFSRVGTFFCAYSWRLVIFAMKSTLAARRQIRINQSSFQMLGDKVCNGRGLIKGKAVISPWDYMQFRFGYAELKMQSNANWTN